MQQHTIPDAYFPFCSRESKISLQLYKVISYNPGPSLFLPTEGVQRLSAVTGISIMWLENR